MADEDVVVRLSVVDETDKAIKGVRANIESNFSAANAKLKESKGAFSDLGNEIKGSFVQAIKGAVLAYAGFQVINKITGFLKMAREEYKENMKLQLQMKAALGYTSDALDKQADALERSLTVEKDIIMAVQTSIAFFTKDEEKIKKLTLATLDFAAATGMD
ncbi:MAG: hypothetical protein IMZ53_01905, partial [Thermoplasmata archaeon]|nr:hypothetical protein [Thermoplasmata archaeon]